MADNNINWFPGHMAKARREISEALKNVDIVLELRDARIPFASQNPMVDEIVGQKPRLILLNKANMADKKVTKDFIDYYKKQGIIALDIDSNDKYNIDKVFPTVKEILIDKINKDREKGKIFTNIRGLVIGIPNVGKSTFINILSKRKAAKVGDKPGVTKSNTWIKIQDGFQILDTPGILWPKFEDQQVAVRLSICGSIKDEVVELSNISFEAIKYLKRLYPDKLSERYDLGDISSLEEIEIIDLIGKKRGCLMKGGFIDYDRVSKLIINDFRSLKIGAMTLERTI